MLHAESSGTEDTLVECPRVHQRVSSKCNCHSSQGRSCVRASTMYFQEREVEFLNDNSNAVGEHSELKERILRMITGKPVIQGCCCFLLKAHCCCANMRIFPGLYNSHIYMIFTDDNSSIPPTDLHILNLRMKHIICSNRGLVIIL